jgi:fluoride exporter
VARGFLLAARRNGSTPQGRPTTIARVEGLALNSVAKRMRRYWLVAIGGGIGTLMRFGISEWISGMGLWNPLAILIINVSGCFLISFLSFVSDPSGEFYLGPRSRIFLLVGLCGGYTTFSSFSLLSFESARHSHFKDLWLNIGFSHLFCLLGVWLGYRIGTPFPRIIARIGRLLRS